MQIFINEKTLHGQYENEYDFTDAIETFLAILEEFRSNENDFQYYVDKSRLASCSPVKGLFFFDSLSKIDLSLSTFFRSILFDKLRAIDWRKEQAHSIQDSYILKKNSEIVTDTSVAELAERELLRISLNGCLLNFHKSDIKEIDSIEVEKNKRDTVLLKCIDNQDQLGRWLLNNLPRKALEYDLSSIDPPKDKQTVLRDCVRFAKTKVISQGRKVFIEQSTGYYWHADNFHFGNAAHLEVFDNSGAHIGEADLYGVIDISKRDSSKKLFK